MKSLLVGCGGIAEVHAEALHALDREIAAFADIRPERARGMADVYGGRAYASLSDMLEKEQADVLHICTPHYLHVPMAIEALQKGMHVVMEKPPAMTGEQEEELRRVLSGAPGQLAVCFQNRYNPANRRVKELLEKKELGEVKGARAFVTWEREAPYYTESGWRGTWKTEGGGVLINQSIHTLDLLCYLLGDPRQVSATIANHHLRDVIEVEDSAEARIVFKSGAVGLFYATTGYCTDSPVLVEIVCEKGCIRIEGDDLLIQGEGGRREQIHFAPAAHVGKDCWGASHLLLLRDFYHCIETGKPFALDYTQACRTLHLMLAIYESNRTGQSVCCE